MASFISAGPTNPVIFTLPDVVFHHEVNISVTWDTGNSAVTGRVFRSLNGGAETALAGALVSSGTAADKISLGQVLTFALRRATSGEELARTTVTTEKNALAAFMTDPDLDFIFSLKVNPAADTIGVAFRTKQSAVPFVEIRRHDSRELVDSWMGGGFRQVHQREFNGVGRGLPQDTEFDVRIVALKDIGGGRVRLGSGGHNPEVRGSVTTGTRTVSFLFDLIHVRNDGDPGGAGEFSFQFGVGDVVTQKRLGPRESWGQGDIPAGYDREVAKVITIDHAPRRMWAQVVARESDSSFGDQLGHPGIPFDIGRLPSYAPPGSDGVETDAGSDAWVTAHFDTDQTGSGRQRGFVMSTGDFSIAYDVFGSMTVTRRDGTSNFPGMFIPSIGRAKPRRKGVQSATLPAGGTRTFGTSQGVATVSLGPDGAVILRIVDPSAGTGSVADLGGRFDTSITLVASSDDTLYVLGVTPTGEVLARTVMPKSASEDGWTELGGAFIGAVTGVARDYLVDVLARDAEGRVFHRMLSPGRSDGDWRQIGSGVASPVAAIGTPSGDLVVFGLGTDGRILHKRLIAGGEWTPRSGEWEILCRVDDRTAAEGIIAVHWATEKDLIVSAFVGDDLAGALLWQSYPEPDRDAAWVVSVASVGRKDIT